MMLPAGNFSRTASQATGAEAVSGRGGASVDTVGNLLLCLAGGAGDEGAVLLAVAGDPLLQLEDAVHQPLRGGRAARDVDVERDDLVDPLHDVVGAVEAARAGAGAHRDHPFGVRH